MADESDSRIAVTVAIIAAGSRRGAPRRSSLHPHRPVTRQSGSAHTPLMLRAAEAMAENWMEAEGDMDAATLPGSPVACDYGSVNGQSFFCTFGVGFDAAVSDAFARGKHRGLVSYVNNTIRQFVNYNADEYTIRANGQIITEQAFLVAVCNASQYGNNAYIAPRATMTDGLLDITIIHAGNPLSTMLVGVDMLTGYTYRNALVDTIRVSSATIERKHPGPAHIDGEPVALGETLEVRCHPGQLWLYTNPDERPFRPIITPIASMIREARYSINRIFHPSLR